MTARPEPDSAAALAVSITFEIALPLALNAELPAADQIRTDDRQWLPSSKPPQPLFTLHSAFLI